MKYKQLLGKRNVLIAVYVLLFAVVGAYVLIQSRAASTFPTTRDVYQWPFAQNSVWNMPIGSNAVYKPTGFEPVTRATKQGGITLDEKYLGLNPNDPVKTLRQGDYSAGAGCEYQNTNKTPNPTAIGTRVHVPAHMTAPCKLNGSTSLLVEGTKYKYIEGNRLWIDPAGSDPRVQYSWNPLDLKGNGWDGGTGGGSQSAVGGTIRKGELSSSEPIRHALRLNVFGNRFLSRYDEEGNLKGHMWPALRADGNFNEDPSHRGSYNGTVPYVRMGTLLAIEPGTDLSWITSPKVKKLAQAATDYGFYIVDNTAWDVWGLNAEWNARSEVMNSDIGSQDEYFAQIQKLILSLKAVTNNSPTSIGGGGTPRAPLAPCFDDEPDCDDSEGSDTEAPSVPANLAAESADGAIILNWAASSDNAGVAGYDVRYRQNGAETWNSNSTTNTTYKASGLTNGTQYELQVRAYDAAGNKSGFTGSVTATPEAITQTSYITKDESFDQGASITSSSDVSGTFAADKAVDGDELTDSSRWISAAQDNEKLTLDLGTTKSLEKVAYLFAGNTTKDYKVEASTDNSAYEQVATGQTSNMEYELKEHTFSPVTARYVRFTGISRWNSDYGHSVREMAVYTSTTENNTVTLPLRINAGGGNYTDSQNNQWSSDMFYDDSTGGTHSITGDITGTSDDAIYQSERWCPSSYNIPVRNGDYTVRLHFAEINPPSGSRIFGMSAEGQVLFNNYNISSDIGNYVADVKTANVTVGDSELTLSFNRIDGCPKIAGIEVFEKDNAEDNTVPSVQLMSPTEGSVVSGSVQLVATASDNVKLENVVFSIDSEIVETDTTDPYEATLDTKQYSNGQYTVTATALDSSGNAATSSSTIAIENPVLDTMPPTVPADVTITNKTYSSVELGWGASDDTTGVDYYIVLRNGSAYAFSNSTAYTDQNVNAETTYEYSIKAVDVIGNVSAASDPISVTTPAAPDTQPPSVPSDMTASSVTDTSATLSWTAASDNVGIEGYYVYRDGSIVAAINKTTYTDDTLSPGTSYTYHVRAFDSAGNVGDAAQANVTTKAQSVDTTPPTPPQELTATAVKNNQVNLSWKAATDDSGYVAYVIYRDGLIIATTTSTSFGDGTVNPVTSYSYVVRAIDTSENISLPSNSVSLIPKDNRFSRRGR